MISLELLDKLIDGVRIEDFDEILEETGCDPVFIAYTLTSTLKRLARRGGDAYFFRKEDLTPLFRAQARGDVTKGALPSLLTETAEKKRPKPAEE